MGKVTFVKLPSARGDMLVNLEDIAAVTVTSDWAVKVLGKGGEILVNYSCRDAAQQTAQLKSVTRAVSAAADEHNANVPDGVI